MALRRSVLTVINTNRRASLRLCGAKNFSSQPEPKEEEKRKTHFGFETVNEDEKTKKDTVINYHHHVSNALNIIDVQKLYSVPSLNECTAEHRFPLRRLQSTTGQMWIGKLHAPLRYEPPFYWNAWGVHQVFETVANKYDLMNDVMSFGVHRLWKDIFMLRLAPTPGTKLLDMAGGTGDITVRYVNYLRNKGLSAADKRSSVTVCDINQHMLDVGKARADRQGLTKDTAVDIEWLCADAESLPLPDDSYSAYTIAFGIRNCTHVDKVLEEAYRVLQPGGRFLCLEFSQLPNTTMQWVYDQYSFQMIPVMGQLVAGQWKPYKYLVESIRQFPNQEKFKSMIEEAGFRQVTYENLTFGVCAIHSGFKI